MKTEEAESHEPLPTGVGGGPRAIPVEVATDQIAEARCKRATRCGLVGQGKEHATQQECLASYARVIVDQIDTTHCPLGINPSALSHCVEEATSESCTHAFEGAEHTDSCRAPDLCYGR